jgi:hypothetical protein
MLVSGERSQTRPIAHDAGPLCALARPDMVERAEPRAAIVSQIVRPPNCCASPCSRRQRALHDPGLVKVPAPFPNAATAAGLLMLKSSRW